jgi:Type I phosphodiesterase / nucleotide pyrophosphatase
MTSGGTEGKPGLRIALLAIVIAVLAPLVVFGGHLPRFVTSDGGLDRSQCARSALAPPAPPGRVVVVIVDGLGYEHFEGMSELEWLRDLGAYRPLLVEFPSYTTPAILSFVTGIGPRDSGVRLNAPTRAVTEGIDHIGAVAQDAALPIDFFDGGWAPLGEVVFATEATLWRGRLAAEVGPFVAHGDRGLRLLYFGAVDREGHRHGAASSAYAEAGQLAARYLRRVWTTLDPARDRMMMVSDHGHLATGGHGGVEPEVMRATVLVAGAGVARGAALEPRPMVDVASTIAVLAGMSPPGCNVGQPMLDMLTVPETERARLLAPAFDQAAGLHCRLMDHPSCAARAATTVMLSAGDPGALERGSAVLAGMRASRQAAQVLAARSGRIMRLAVAVVLLFGFIGWRLRRKAIPPASTWVFPFVLLGIYFGVLVAMGYRLTFSIIPPQIVVIRDATIASVPALAATFWLARRRPRGAAAATLFGATAPFALMAAYAGVEHAVLPSPHVGMLILLWGPAVLGACLVALVLRA